MTDEQQAKARRALIRAEFASVSARNELDAHRRANVKKAIEEAVAALTDALLCVFHDAWPAPTAAERFGAEASRLFAAREVARKAVDTNYDASLVPLLERLRAEGGVAHTHLQLRPEGIRRIIGVSAIEYTFCVMQDGRPGLVFGGLDCTASELRNEELGDEIFRAWQVHVDLCGTMNDAEAALEALMEA